MIDTLEKAKKNMTIRESLLSGYACKSENGINLKNDSQDIRPIFYRDIDKIIHSLAYTRYIDKTQVYSFVENDHITHRVLHVQLVSKIARTIGRSLGLNEDLIEAIALGHDVGHAPFGHMGEKYLNEICKKENIGYFYHNAQSVRVLKDLEKLNISVQTLDGILAHNGEILINKYEPDFEKNKYNFLEEFIKSFQEDNYSKRIKPMTLEGSVVRLSDIIAYVGRDIEDSIKIGNIKREDLPKNATKILGNTNSKIVDTLIKDIIQNSFDKPYLMFSEECFEGLLQLKDWNYENIYSSKEATKNQNIIKKQFNNLYYYYLEKISKNKLKENTKLKDFIENNSIEGKNEENIKRLVIDYIAGQTDNYFLKECNKYLKLNTRKLYT